VRRAAKLDAPSRDEHVTGAAKASTAIHAGKTQDAAGFHGSTRIRGVYITWHLRAERGFGDGDFAV
jgi:hypothetical protein